MALIVEDGSIVDGAESYISVADADAYHTARNHAGWTGSNAVKEAALREATTFMQGTYGGRWKGYQTNAAEQDLDWPRADVVLTDGLYDVMLRNDEIPRPVREACAELAMRALSSPLAPDLGRETSSESVGEISVTYREGAPQHTTYRAIDLMLSKYLRSSSSMTRVYR